MLNPSVSQHGCRQFMTLRKVWHVAWHMGKRYAP